MGKSALTTAKDWERGDLISIPSPANISSYNLLCLCIPGLGRLIYFYSLLGIYVVQVAE